MVKTTALIFQNMMKDLKVKACEFRKDSWDVKFYYLNTLYLTIVIGAESGKFEDFFWEIEVEAVDPAEIVQIKEIKLAEIFRLREVAEDICKVFKKHNY